MESELPGIQCLGPRELNAELFWNVMSISEETYK